MSDESEIPSGHGIIPKHGGFRNLRSFQIAQLVYDRTVAFCEQNIDRRSRTHDQMVQAARSGVQNIAEGSLASATSKKFELKLTGVARASLGELLLDYEDFLRHKDLRLWEKDSAEALAVRNRYKSDRSDNPDVSDKPDRSEMSDLSDPETQANTTICLIHQASYLLWRQMQSLEKAFLSDGGFSEQLYRARNARRKQP